MKRIPLTQGYYAIVDDADFAALSSERWHASRNYSGNVYARRNAYLKGASAAVPIMMHRFITGAKPGQIVDHINGNGLDNRRKNLRFVTVDQNRSNQGTRSACGFKGVILAKKKRRDGSYRISDLCWLAQIVYKGRQYKLGQYRDPADAARAYDAKAIEFHGEYARTNASMGLLP